MTTAQIIDTLPRDGLIPWPDVNPRRRFSEEEIQELRASLKKDGMIQPIGVKLNAEAPHWVFAGERRFRASEGILEELPVVVRDIDKETALRLSLTENIQRANLSPIEEAWGLDRYLEESAKTQKAVGKELGKTQGWISNRIRLLKLSEALQELVLDEIISPSQARDLVLPFSGIAETSWAELQKQIVPRLRKKADGKALDDDDVRGIVGAAAVKLSRWITDPLSAGEGEAAGVYEKWSHVRRIPDKDAPKGSLVSYVYSSVWQGHKSKRCFDIGWWELAVAKEAERLEKLREQNIAGVVTKKREYVDLDWSPDKGPVPAEMEIPGNQEHVVYSPSRHGGLRADPTDIPVEFLVLREEKSDGDRWENREGEVLCTNAEAFERAHDLLWEDEKKLFARRMKARTKADLKASCSIDPRKALPTLVSIGWWNSGWSASQVLQEAADHIGLEMPNWTGNHHETYGIKIRDWLAALEPAELDKLLALAVYRCTEGDGTVEGEIESEAREELHAKLTKELAAKVEFDLPTPLEEEQEDAA